MQRNRTRAKLAKGEPVLGCFLRHPDPGLAEFLALQGFDFIVFDGEHGPLTPPMCEQLVRAVQLHDVTPLVRVEENRAASVLRYLDAGALGCHLPGIGSRDDAVKAVRAVKFRPQGDRGLSASRATGYGARDGYAAYTARANRETQVIAHIESAAGVAAVEEIAMVEGLDVLLFGALDLSHDLGCPGEFSHPEIVAAADRVNAAATSAGKALGVVVKDAAGARDWINRGARYVLATFESLVESGIKSYIAEVPGWA